MHDLARDRAFSVSHASRKPDAMLETQEINEGSGWLTEQLRERGNAVMNRLFAQESFPGQGWPYDKSCPPPPPQQIPPSSEKSEP